MAECADGDYVRFDDVQPLLERLRQFEQAQADARPVAWCRRDTVTGCCGEQQAEPESVIKRQAQKIGELIADRDSWIEAHARLYRLYHDQSPKAGEEIHVNVEGGDVYTLPLQLSGMDEPRFVVHVPCSEQAEPGADERAAFEASGLYPGLMIDAQSGFSMGYRAAQSGQRAGVAITSQVLDAVACYYYDGPHRDAHIVNRLHADALRLAATTPTQQEG
ncbi:hypothetical protein VZ52_13440 [Ralstonia mannitolilytica]|nr:hypothetical protein VZ52_13440 [Ralstonia mannitolilytica]